MRCAGCGLRAVHNHHVVYRQHLRQHGGDVLDGANFLPMCLSCHAAHHNASWRIPVSCLRDENLAYASELLGLAAFDYFVRRYADDGDPRLDELLEEEVA